MHYEHINGAKINIERLSNEELQTLKGHVLHKLDEVMEDHHLVMDEINSRVTQEYQDPLDELQQPEEQTVPSE